MTVAVLGLVEITLRELPLAPKHRHVHPRPPSKSAPKISESSIRATDYLLNF